MFMIDMYTGSMEAADRTPVPSTGYLVWRLAVKWRAELDRALAPLGLTSAQYGLLASLHGLSRMGGQPSQRHLAEFSGLEPMFVSKLARALERGGLVERAVSASDPRARALTLTTRGAEVVAKGRTIVSRLEERRLTVLGGADSERSAALQDTLLALLHGTQEPDTVPAAAARRPARQGNRRG
jgi:DNA-binding MarR family transcriptional regulator